MQVWTNVIGPADVPGQAAAAEQAGWDGTVLYDSQNFNCDCYVVAGLVAGATSTLRIGTGVTNPFTRHPAVTANAAATVQATSGGRFTLGIGRGDSSNASVGFAPSSVSSLEHYVSVVRRFLQRDAVPMADLERYGRGTKPAAETLHLARTFEESQLGWWEITADAPPNVDIAATGPRVIKLGATTADSISLTVGADPERVAWAIGVARDARAAAGISGDLDVGVYLNIACHPDKDVALDLIRGPVAALARFSMMHGKTVTPVSDVEEEALRKLNGTYDMTEHGRSTSAQAETIDAEFARRFAVMGDPDACLERIRLLHDLGVSRFILLGAEPNTPRSQSSPDAKRSHELIEKELLRALATFA